MKPGASDIHFADLLATYAADRALETGDISAAEADVILRTVAVHVGKFEGRPCDVLFTRKMGSGQCFLVQSSTELYIEDGAKAVLRLPLAGCVEQIKMQLP
jgi:hypothetical protein